MRKFRVTRTEFAKLIDSTPDRVSKLIAEGLPTVETGNGRGHKTILDLDKALPWLFKRRAGSLDAAKTKLALVQAQLADQMLQLRAKQVISADEVEKVWAAEVAAVRAIILASYTTHADRVHRAGVLEGLTGIERAMKEVAYGTLRELANPDRDIPKS